MNTASVLRAIKNKRQSTIVMPSKPIKQLSSAANARKKYRKSASSYVGSSFNSSGTFFDSGVVSPLDRSDSSGDEKNNKVQKPTFEIIDETHEASNSSSEEDKKEEKATSPGKKHRNKESNDNEFFGKDSSDSSSSNYSDEGEEKTNPEHERQAKEFFDKMQKLDSKNE